jgi:CHASE2 domain-containing sensor protein/tRNA A-37 threonylcarbamoyl transferase component Bud32
LPERRAIAAVRTPAYALRVSTALAPELVRRFRRPAVIVGVGLAVAALACLSYEKRLFRRIELSTVDSRFAIRGKRTPPRDLVIVQIDDASINTLGSWPFSRAVHAQAIRRIIKDNPQVIAYDVQFTERSANHRADDALVAAVADSRKKVVLATTEPSVTGFLLELGAKARVGNTGLPNDPGAVVRRLPYSVVGMKAFALEAAEVASGHRIDRSSLGGDSAWIDFYGPPNTIPAISFARVASRKVSPGYFSGKVVVVGAVAPSLQDLHTTSVSGDGQMAGPEIVASAISTALRGFPLRTVPGSVNLVLIGALSLLVPLANLRFRLPFALGTGAVGGGAFAAATQFAFNAGWIVAFIYPVGALLASSIAVFAARYAIAVVDARKPDTHPLGQLPVGASLAGYRTERLLGRGGGGTVYLATDTALRRKVALKILIPELNESDEFRRRFLHESQLAAALDHPNVVPIYRAGEEDGRLFVAMKWVRGSLAALLRRDGVLEVTRAIAIIEQVATALDAAHALGLVHRDVTPSNILLEPPRSSEGTDHVYLADFGLTLHHGLTSAVERVGKPDYVAPEQIRGEAVDGRADLYSLGCVLYECLVGEPPFSSDSEITIIGGHLSRPAPSVLVRRSDAPPGIDAVIACALAKAPHDRYESCVAFAQAARVAERGPPIEPLDRRAPWGRT